MAVGQAKMTSYAYLRGCLLGNCGCGCGATFDIAGRERRRCCAPVAASHHHQNPAERLIGELLGTGPSRRYATEIAAKIATISATPPIAPPTAAATDGHGGYSVPLKLHVTSASECAPALSTSATQRYADGVLTTPRNWGIKAFPDYILESSVQTTNMTPHDSPGTEKWRQLICRSTAASSLPEQLLSRAPPPLCVRRSRHTQLRSGR